MFGEHFKLTYALPLAYNIITIDTAETSQYSLSAECNEKSSAIPYRI